MRCQHITFTGEQCKRNSLYGYCYQHTVTPKNFKVGDLVKIGEYAPFEIIKIVKGKIFVEHVHTGQCCWILKIRAEPIFEN